MRMSPSCLGLVSVLGLGQQLASPAARAWNMYLSALGRRRPWLVAWTTLAMGVLLRPWNDSGNPKDSIYLRQR